MGALSDAIAAETAAKGPTCSTIVLRDRMDKSFKQDFDAALADDTIPTSTIARTLRKFDYQISEQTLNRHRKGRCACRQQ